MRENRREEARELMKWVLEKNDQVEPGRKVSRYIYGFHYLYLESSPAICYSRICWGESNGLYRTLDRLVSPGLLGRWHEGSHCPPTVGCGFRSPRDGKCLEVED